MVLNSDFLCFYRCMLVHYFCHIIIVLLYKSCYISCFVMHVICVVLVARSWINSTASMFFKDLHLIILNNCFFSFHQDFEVNEVMIRKKFTSLNALYYSWILLIDDQVQGVIGYVCWKKLTLLIRLKASSISSNNIMSTFILFSIWMLKSPTIISSCLPMMNSPIIVVKS